MHRVHVISDNIICPLGTTSNKVYECVCAGESAARLYGEAMGLAEPFYASLIDEEALQGEYAAYGIPEGYTRFERRLILSIKKALAGAGGAGHAARSDGVAGIGEAAGIAGDSGARQSSRTSVDPVSDRTLFIISSTKGNVDLLDGCGAEVPERELLGTSARLISSYFGNPNPSIVVSNACISGLCAIIEGMRAIISGRYDTVVVAGSDVQSRFIISGFQSLKALSAEACRPFDAGRTGLNLGEAAATMILSAGGAASDWCLLEGAIRNDANHISGPSRSGEGSYRTLKAVLGDLKAGDLALANVHGTSTAYNDEMEAVALFRAGLDKVPVSALKGYFGHTLGAAGIVETIISMRSIEAGLLPASKGYSVCGVSHPLNISARPMPLKGKAFVKLLSGFGGCNAALLAVKGDDAAIAAVSGSSLCTNAVAAECAAIAPCAAVAFEKTGLHTVAVSGSASVASEGVLASGPSLCSGLAAGLAACGLSISHSVRISPKRVIVDGVEEQFEGEGQKLLADIYRKRVGDYPKFFRMDELSRLGFLASELLLNAEAAAGATRALTPAIGITGVAPTAAIVEPGLSGTVAVPAYATSCRLQDCESRSIIFFNRHASLCDDRHYQESMAGFPSPGLFVYTLPNIVTGEIAIRNKYYGETSFYVLNAGPLVPQHSNSRSMAALDIPSAPPGCLPAATDCPCTEAATSATASEIISTMTAVISDAFQDSCTESILTGWLDCAGPEHFLADIFLVLPVKVA